MPPGPAHPLSLLHPEGSQLASLLVHHLPLLAKALNNTQTVWPALTFLLRRDTAVGVDPGHLLCPFFLVSSWLELSSSCLGVLHTGHPWQLLLLGVEAVEHFHFSFAVPSGSKDNDVNIILNKGNDLNIGNEIFTWQLKFLMLDQRPRHLYYVFL